MQDLYGILRRHDRLIAVGFWVTYLAIGAIVESLSVITEYRRVDRPLATWEPFVWEFSSALVIALLIVAVAGLNRRFRFTAGSWRRPLLVHMLATVPFSLLHVGGMVAIRETAYRLAGRSYDFGNLMVELPYEFRKDFVTYWFIVGVLYLWQYLKFVNAARPAPDDVPSESLRRLVARKRGREFVINVDDVEWVEASGNYANLHHPDGVFPVRVPMGELEKRLDPARFARVHRSGIVNLDRVKAIEPTDAGDHLICMENGDRVRMSRRYRSILRDRLAVPAR